MAPCLAAAGISVTLKLDREEVTTLDSIEMVISVSGTQKNVSQPTVKGLESFNVTRGGTSSRVEIVNGKVNAGIDYTYIIQPKSTGTFTIGPAEVSYKGKTYRSNTSKLLILKPAKTAGDDEGPLFLKASLSSKEVFVEEQAIYTLKLYRRVNVRDISLSMPQIEHVTFTQLGKPKEYQSVYNGKSYNVLEVRYLLVSSVAGNYAMGPSKMDMTVLQRRRSSPRSLFDDPFFKDPFFSFSSGQPKTVASKTLEMTVLSLPQKGRPSDFNGLVGTFNIESILEPSEIKAGESATFTIVLKGRGNIKRIPDLKIPELDNTKIYADQPQLKEEMDSKGLAGSKTMKWALVPEKEGIYQIPPLSTSFFDPTSRQYRVIKTSPLSLSVLPGQKEQVKVSAIPPKDHGSKGPMKKTVKELGHDILPIHTSTKDLNAWFRGSIRGVFVWVVLLTPFFIYTVTFWGLKFRKRSADTIAVVKAKKAAKKFIKRCSHGRVSANDMSFSIRDYLNDRYSLSLGSLTPYDAYQILQSKGVSNETSEKLRDLVQKIEDAIYTGKGQEIFPMEEEIIELIKQVEKESR